MPLRFQTRQQRCETLEWNLLKRGGGYNYASGASLGGGEEGTIRVDLILLTVSREFAPSIPRP